MDLNFSAFQEPRGVMRIIQFIFSICAFATVTGYSGILYFNCGKTESETFGYPFDFHISKNFSINNHNCTLTTSSASTSDATFFVTTGVLSMLYALVIIAFYAKFDDKYKTDTRLPLFDFLLTVLFAVLWLSSSAAWANGLSGLKEATSPPVGPSVSPDCKDCSVTSGSFTSLSMSVLLGFLNFFLWAADLWFLYKETTWFQGNQPRPAQGV